MRLVCILCLLLAANFSAAGSIAIVLDDLGNNLLLGRQAVNLPGAVTYAFLPHTPHAALLSTQAHELGKESMLHLPMQSINGKRLGPGALQADMSVGELTRTVINDMESVPHVVGVNNHMGSLMTRDSVAMDALMLVLKKQANLYFLDSRTHDETVAEQAARASGIPTTRRNIFLDNVREEAAIEQQFMRLIKHAKKHGSGVAIGHPFPETLAVLERLIPQLSAQAIVLLPLSQLIKQQRIIGTTLVRLEEKAHQ